MSLPIRTLLPMAADGVGPSFTCAKLVEGALGAGADIDLMVNRYRMKGPSRAVRTVLPGPLSLLPYKPLSGMASGLLERWYLSRLRQGDIGWLWPSVSLRTHEALHKRGVPIVLEGINTRMARAKEVLDAAYDAFGAAPAHGITNARVAEEEQKLALASTIFAPSPDVENALSDSPLAGRFIASSYGVDTSAMSPITPRDSDAVTFVFCGYICVRKGAHYLLDLWREMPKGARLRLVGRIEPLIAQRYADVLASDQIQAVGFTRDVASHYRASDVFVFPSLEEGDPLVTYEAARHGLPIVASGPGAGRIGADTGCATIIDPTNRDGFLAALQRLYNSAEVRAQAGAAAHANVAHYDWNAVGARRVEALRRFFGQGAEG